MQRTLISSLARSARLARSTAPVGARVALRPMAATFPSSRFVRFASTEAKPEEQKKEATSEQASETTEETKAETEAEAETPEQSAIAELEAKLAQKDKDLADMKNHYARAIADFRNLQESTKKEVQKAKDFALQKFAKDLLESVDNFTLALSAVKEETLSSNAEVKNLYDGVDMTRQVFEKTLNRHGIEKIDPMGEPFNPNHHEATFEIPQPDKEPGTVFHVQQPGFTLNSRVLRPAKVGLVKDVEN
ncbi:grpE protein homolog, mitochondrial [[Candida] railenensis]|uniref:GrpE protein homolog, mitochondrial n=1 Tax=[Candida] railenensis TaxID=45579 RepID=A0A9P0W0H4_9ASCO|nr:grpE protein homolog, mitochondrial [[Candida] railenensis]